MIPPIAPFKEADLPRREKAFWQMTGPGAVLVGLSIGTGELILWPWITTKFGATMVWAAFVGVFLQLWINIEIGRWAVATGESAFTGLGRVWSGLLGVFLLFNFVLMFLPAWALTSGQALKALLLGPEGWGAAWVWTAITFLAIAGILFGPKTVYVAVERSTALLVVLIVAGMLYLIFRVGTVDDFLEMGRGILNVGHVELDDELTFSAFFSAVVFAGAGGLGNLFYAYYLRDKQIGMGARIPRLVNPLRQEEEAAPGTGYRYPDTAENARRFRDWLRYVILDQTYYFWLLNSFTMFLFMFGALAVLHPRGLVPSQNALVWDLAAVLEGILGSFGRYLFLLIGVAALFSTQLTFVDGGARTFVELLRDLSAGMQRYAYAKLYVAFACFIMAMGVFSSWLFTRYEMTALGFILNAALLNGFAMAIYCPAILYINLKVLPPSARPGPICILMSGLASLVYVAFAGYTLYRMITG